MNAEKWFKEKLDAARNTFDYRLEKVLIQLGEDMCLLMEQQRLSRTQLAERMGVSPAYITKILDGNPNLTIKSLLKLSDALGRELTVQFASKGEREPSSSARPPRRALSAARP
jgi:transcriptional regulator with XRE-family HTH domain